MPPAGLTPTWRPPAARKSRTASSITSVFAGVALTATLPVEVLMKSAPASIASQEARRTLSYVASSPFSKMTFRWASSPSSRAHASFTARISSKTCM